LPASQRQLQSMSYRYAIVGPVNQLQGIELRYVLTMHLSHHGPATIAEMIDALAWHGFCVRGRPSKAVSDALRWEIGRGRVRRLERGLYAPRYIPRSTEYRIHQRVLALRAAARLSLGGGQKVDPLSAEPGVTDVTERAEPVGRAGPMNSRLEAVAHTGFGQQMFGM
jgi:hypothetical protein